MGGTGDQGAESGHRSAKVAFVDIAKRSFREARRDNITGEAAKAAYYCFLSFFPLLLAAFAFAGFLGDSAFSTLMSWITRTVPPAAAEALRTVVAEITQNRKPGALTFGIVMTVWSASNFFSALGDGLDAMFDVTTGTWWKKRVKAIAMMFTGGLLLVAGGVIIVAGPAIFEKLGIGGALTLLRWPIVYLLLVAIFWLFYFILPGRSQRDIKRQLLIGALAGTTLWLVATAGFRVYVATMGNYGAAYGSLGGVIVMILWLYLTAVAILFGGEVADVLSHGMPGRAQPAVSVAPTLKEGHMDESLRSEPADPSTLGEIPELPVARRFDPTRELPLPQPRESAEHQVERQVRKVEAHVRARPFMTVAIALTAGFLLGRVLRD